MSEQTTRGHVRPLYRISLDPESVHLAERPRQADRPTSDLRVDGQYTCMRCRHVLVGQRDVKDPLAAGAVSGQRHGVPFSAAAQAGDLAVQASSHDGAREARKQAAREAAKGHQAPSSPTDAAPGRQQVRRQHSRA